MQSLKMTQPKSKSRSRSNTPPAFKPKPKDNPQRVEFSPISSAPRRGSSASGSGHGLHSHHGKLHSKESVDREKQRRLELVARARERREAMLKRVRREKKAMLFSSILAFLALFLWFVAVFTDHWFYVKQSEESLERAFNSSGTMREFGGQRGEVFLSSKTGLWKKCSYFENVKSQLPRGNLQCFHNLNIYIVMC